MRRGRAKKDQGSAAAPARFEIQIHPSDIRRGVRYLFLTRRQLVWAALGVLAYAGFLAFAVVVTPGVIASRWTLSQYQDLLEEREALGRDLQPQVAELELLAGRAADLRLTMDRVFLAYGLDLEDTDGQGGYPLEAQPVPASLKAGIYGQTLATGHRLSSTIEEQLRVVHTFAGEIEELDQAKRELTLTTPSVTPLKRESFVLTSPFGNRRNPFTNSPDFHAGVDLAALEGTDIYAPADARVVWSGRYPLSRSRAWWQYGELVILSHRDDLISLYGHCAEVFVRKGQKVRRGDRIATVGDTGHSTNPHLHYEVRRRDDSGKLVPVDPRIYMLDLELNNSEELLVARRRAPSFDDFEPLPKLIAR